MTELIKAASIARVTSKAGKFLGFLVKSDNTTEYYQVTCLKINGHCEFFCNCKGFKSHGHCKHCNACKELVAARKEMKEAAPVETTPAEQAQTGKFHAGMFVGNRGCSVYVSNEEMDALKARVATRKAARQEDEKSFPKAKNASCKARQTVREYATEWQSGLLTSQTSLLMSTGILDNRKG